MKDNVLKMWPEINWIKNEELRNKTLDAWARAIENKVLSAEDLEVIPLSLLIKDVNVSFMNQKRTCVQLAVDIAMRMPENFGAAIAFQSGLPAGVQPIIATHPKEGDPGMRTVESFIVHHADFVSFEPFKA